MLSDEQQKLAEDNINLVFYVIHKHKFSIEDADIGYIALCKAAKSYKPDIGYAFTTYAIKCIMNEFLYNKRKENGRLHDTYHMSLDKPVAVDSEGKEITLLDVVPDTTSLEGDVIYSEFINKYNEYLKTLSDKHRNIILLYHQGLTQREIADKVGGTQAHISRIIRKVNKEFIHKYYSKISLVELEEELNKWQKK